LAIVLKVSILLFSLLFLISCTVSPRYNANSSSSSTSKVTKSAYKKSNSSTKTLRGISSWYGPNFHGKLTANGEIYDMYGTTAAHKTLPLNTIVRVTNLDNGKSIILKINDRGPYVGDRILDCSFGAAKKLGFDKLGTTSVEIDIIEIGDDIYMHH
jgi:rare lipoprotein A